MIVTSEFEAEADKSDCELASFCWIMLWNIKVAPCSHLGHRKTQNLRFAQRMHPASCVFSPSHHWKFSVMIGTLITCPMQHVKLLAAMDVPSHGHYVVVPRPRIS